MQVSTLPPEKPTVLTRALQQMCRLCIRTATLAASLSKAIWLARSCKMRWTRARRYANHRGGRKYFGSSRTSYRDGSMLATTQPSAKASSISFRHTAPRPLFARLGVREQRRNSLRPGSPMQAPRRSTADPRPRRRRTSRCHILELFGQFLQGQDDADSTPKPPDPLKCPLLFA